MQKIKEAIPLNSKKNINLNSRKLIKPMTKQFSGLTSKKHNLIIRLNSKFAEFQSKKTHSILYINENLKLSDLKSKNTKEINISKNLFNHPSEEVNKKIFIEDKYLNEMKNKIYNRITRKYINFSLSDFTTKKNIQKNKTVEFFSYYNYYLICNLVDNKKTKFSLDYFEYLTLYNKQEYLIKYFIKEEIYIIMNYLLYIVYGNDIATKVNKSKKLLSIDEIKSMFNDLVNNNYKFKCSKEITKDIGTSYNYKDENLQKRNTISNLENIKPIYNEKIIYKYAKDIPNSQISNCIPKYYNFENQIMDCIKNFIHKRRLIKINIYAQNRQNGELNQRKKRRYYTNKNRFKKNNILENISFSLNDDKFNFEESKEINADKKRYKSSQRKKYENGINDIESFLKKLVKGSNNVNDRNKKNNENKFVKSLSGKIIGKRNKKTKSMINIPFNFIKNKEKIFLSSKQNEPKSLNKQNFLSKIFKTSLKNGKNSSKNDVNYNKNNGKKNLILKSENEKYKSFENIFSTTNKEGKNVRNNFINKISTKYKARKNRNQNHEKLIKFNGFSSSINNGNKIANKNNLKDINSSISIKSSDDSLFFYKIKNISKFTSQTNKNKYSINKFISLKKLNNYSTKNNSKPKKFVFQGGIKKAFSSYSSMSLEDKEINVWENNKIDTDIINVAVKSSFLLNKMENIDTKFKKSFYNCNTLKKLIKYPMIYFSNYK